MSDGKDAKAPDQPAGFEFIRHEKYNLPEWRLKALEKEMHDIIDAILDKDALRTRQIAVKEKNRE